MSRAIWSTDNPGRPTLSSSATTVFIEPRPVVRAMSDPSDILGPPDETQFTSVAPDRTPSEKSHGWRYEYILLRHPVSSCCVIDGTARACCCEPSVKRRHIRWNVVPCA